MPRLRPSDTLAATKALGRKLCLVKAGAENELEAAFADLAQQKVAGLFIASSARFLAWNDKLVALSARYAMPASFAARQFADTGGLITYGTDIFEAYRQAGVYAGRILKGAKPADLPVQQPTKFELVINLKTAKALGLDSAADPARPRRRGDRMMGWMAPLRHLRCQTAG